MSDWNPSLYLQFSKERTKPVEDLINNLDGFQPQFIADVGCGPGNSTKKLINKWPKSDITGFDSSKNMIERATAEISGADFKLKMIEPGESLGEFDLIFSNAAIQWIPDHENLFVSFYQSLNSNGKVAVQLPMFFDMELGQTIRDVAESPRWNNKLRSVTNSMYFDNYKNYYDILTEAGFSNIRMWQTNYYHIFPGHDTIYEMISSTGLRPYMEKLEEMDQVYFSKLVKEGIQSSYHMQENGNVILPFIRLFIIGERED